MAYGSRTKVLTIMIVDIVSYTSLSSVLGRERFDEVNEDFDRISLPLFEKYGGKVIKKVGDAFMVVFESATDSLHCAIELQNKFWEYRESRAGVPLKIKVALNTGEVIFRNNDIYGEAVNVVSRVEKATKPGQIYFTYPVFLAMNKNEIPSVYVGAKRFKGVHHMIKLFRVKGLHDKTRESVVGWFGNIAMGLFRLAFWIAIFSFLGFLIYELLVVAGFWDNVSNFVSNLVNKFV